MREIRFKVSPKEHGHLLSTYVFSSKHLVYRRIWKISL